MELTFKDEETGFWYILRRCDVCSAWVDNLQQHEDWHRSVEHVDQVVCTDRRW